MVLFIQINYSPDDKLMVQAYLKGKILTLRGKCFLKSRLITESRKCFESSLKIMGYNFPENLFVTKLKSFYFLRQQKLLMTSFRRFNVGVLKDSYDNYNDQLADCLAELFKVYRVSLSFF